MPTTPPRSHSQSVEQNKLVLETPRRNLSAVYNRPGPTPNSHKSSVLKKQEGDTDRVDGYKREDYDQYIRKDLHSRVFVDFEVFLKSVLHAPHNWKKVWGPTIKAVKADKEFLECLQGYCNQCNTSGLQEKIFYEPLVKTANAVLGVVSADALGNPQYYHINDPGKLRGGVMNQSGLCPDLVVLHNGFMPSNKELHWANPLHILEVKPYDAAICNGNNLPRLLVDGIDPISNHALPHKPSRYKANKSNPLTTSPTGSGSTSPKPQKRPAKGSHGDDQQKPKKSKKQDTRVQQLHSSPGVSTDQDNSSSLPATEPETQAGPAVQVGRYLLEMFSVPLLRSHATICLVDRDRLQLYHANHSVILVSSAIRFSEPDGLDKFIAVIIAFRYLSFSQNGILDALVSQNTELLNNPDITKDDKLVRQGHQLELTEGESQKKFKVILGDVISRDPAAVGRSTVVLKATSDKWPGKNLVVKISWPGHGRVPEDEFLKKAISEAERTDGKWAINHLPRVYFSKDVVFSDDSTFMSVAGLFKNAKFSGGGYVYEQRALRIIIQEELYPLKSLTNVRDVSQVFVDIACIHRWLHDHPGILHRDLSLNNIMWRLIEQMDANKKSEQKVYGVLTDYDLSSWTEDLKNGYKNTSLQRTGTPPYMALELLDETSSVHLYRHDVESLFYVMLLTCGRHVFGPEKAEGKEEGTRRMIRRGGVLPYQKWFGQPDHETLGDKKTVFFTKMQSIDLSPHFEDFQPWLEDLQLRFSEGFSAKSASLVKQKKRQRLGTSSAEVDQFDDETLGGHIQYSSFIEPVRHLTGELKKLAIRYDPSQIPLPASADVTEVNS